MVWKTNFALDARKKYKLCVLLRLRAKKLFRMAFRWLAYRAPEIARSWRPRQSNIGEVTPTVAQLREIGGWSYTFMKALRKAFDAVLEVQHLVPSLKAVI